MVGIGTHKDNPPSELEGPVARVENLSTSFGSTRVVNDVTLEVMPGEVVGVIGANGSGKTTLLRTIAGLVPSESGSVEVVGESAWTLNSRDRAKLMAYMPQHADRHPFTAYEYVLMGRYPHLGRFDLERPSDREQAWDAMRRTGTVEFANRKLETLSGGERQRVVLARVLVQQAPLLLMDEPTSSLDLHHQILTMNLVRDDVTSRQSSAIVILHDLSLAARFCDRLVLLKDGAVIAEGTPWEVLTPAHLRTGFAVEGLVEPDPVTGKPHVLLLGSEDAGDENRVGEGRTVHLVCGAGSGRELMHQLRVAGYRVTAGVLGQGDSDAEAAERLGIEYIKSPPFSAITDEQHATHVELAGAADVVVLLPMAIGQNNLRNIEALTDANDVIVVESPNDDEIGDYTDGLASNLRSELIERSGTLPETAVLFELARRFSADD